MLCPASAAVSAPHVTARGGVGVGGEEGCVMRYALGAPLLGCQRPLYGAAAGASSALRPYYGGLATLIRGRRGRRGAVRGGAGRGQRVGWGSGGAAGDEAVRHAPVRG